GGVRRARLWVFVYDHGSAPFVEVVPTHHGGDYAELGAHARGEIERRTAPHLGKCDLETRRRFCADQGGRGGGKGRIGSARRAFGVERGEDVFDPFSPEHRLDRLASRHHRPAAGPLPARG